MIAARLVHEIHISVLRILELLLLQFHRRQSYLGRVSRQRNSQPTSEEPAELAAQQHVHSLLITHDEHGGVGEEGGVHSLEY